VRKELVYTIKYIIAMEDGSGLLEGLDSLRFYGEAEVVDVELREVSE